jgi:hypothetical protein
MVEYYTFNNTEKKGFYITDSLSKAIDFLMKLRVLDNTPLIIKNDKGEYVTIEQLDNIIVTVRLEGKLKTISKEGEK